MIKHSRLACLTLITSCPRGGSLHKIYCHSIFFYKCSLVTLQILGICNNQCNYPLELVQLLFTYILYLKT